MPMLTKNQLLLVKIETSYGVDPTPVAGSNAILAEPVEARLDIANLDYPVVRASISAEKIRLGRRMAEFTIRVPLKGSGAAGTPPEISPLLQACAHTETINAGTSVVYKPESTAASMKSVTIHFYYDGRVRRANGCMGNVALQLDPGGYPSLVFTMRGKLDDDEDASLPAGAVFQSTEPVVVESSGVSFGSFNDAVIRSMSYGSNNSMVDRMDLNSAEGVAGVWVTGRNPSWAATVEATLEATKAWFANFVNRVEEAIDITVGTVAGNIITISIPKAAIGGGLDPQNDNGMVTFPLQGQALESTGDDNITLTFS